MPKFSAKELCFCLRPEVVLEVVLFVVFKVMAGHSGKLLWCVGEMVLAEHWCCSVGSTHGNIGQWNIQRGCTAAKGIFTHARCRWQAWARQAAAEQPGVSLGRKCPCPNLVLTNSYGALVPNNPQAGRTILSLEWGVICDTELWGIRIAQVPWLPCKSWQGYVPSSWNLTELHHSECEQGEAWGSEQVLCQCFPAVSIDLTDIGLDSQALFHAWSSGSQFCSYVSQNSFICISWWSIYKFILWGVPSFMVLSCLHVCAASCKTSLLFAACVYLTAVITWYQ